jgi:hypothetical protein
MSKHFSIISFNIFFSVFRIHHHINLVKAQLTLWKKSTAIMLAFINVWQTTGLGKQCLQILSSQFYVS